MAAKIKQQPKKQKAKIVGKFMLHNLTGVTFDFNNKSASRLSVKKGDSFLVDENQMSELTTHPYWNKLINDNYLQELELHLVKPEQISFVGSNVAEAVINDCTDLNQLLDIAKNAYTKKTKVLVANRVEELQTILEGIVNSFPQPRLAELIENGDINQLKTAISNSTIADIEALKSLIKDNRNEIKGLVAEKLQELIDDNK